MDELPKEFNAQVHWVCEQCKQAECHRFLGQYYLRGVLKGRQDPMASTAANYFSNLGELQEKAVMENLDRVEEKVEVEAHSAKSFDVALGGNDGLPVSNSGLVYIRRRRHGAKFGELQKKAVIENLDRVEEKVEVEAHGAKSFDVALRGNDGLPVSKSGLVYIRRRRHGAKFGELQKNAVMENLDRAE